MIEEAAAAAVSGQLNVRVASDIYCQTISACRSLGDFPRAGQWSTEAERWMRRESVGGYPGVCQVHRAELKMLHGSFPEAEQEARVACEQLERFQLFFDAGWGRYQLGEVRRRMGDLDAAAEAFERAYAYGHDGAARARPPPAGARRARRGRAVHRRGLAAARRPGFDARSAGPCGAASRPGRGRRGARRLDTARAASAELTEFAAEFELADLRGERGDGPRRGPPGRGQRTVRLPRYWPGHGASGRRRTCPSRAPGRGCCSPRRCGLRAMRPPRCATCGRRTRFSPGWVRRSSSDGSRRCSGAERCRSPRELVESRSGPSCSPTS